MTRKDREDKIRRLEELYGIGAPVHPMPQEAKDRLAEIFAKGAALSAGQSPLPPWPKRPLDHNKRNAWLEAVFQRGKGRKPTVDMLARRAEPERAADLPEPPARRVRGPNGMYLEYQ